MRRRAIENWLLAACDPVTDRDALPELLEPLELAAALAAAADHAVLGAALASAATWRVEEQTRTAEANAECASVLREFRDRHFCDVGRTLGLRQIAVQATGALAAAGIPSTILKGEDFAARLYPTVALRPCRDVDLLVPHEAYMKAHRVLESLGFEPVDPVRKYASEDYGQISYFSASAERWSLELHWNLINSPAQRQQCSVTWDDLEFESAADAGGPRRLTAESLLILATVHACVGHRFDSLQQLCDIRQICRCAAGKIDPERLMEACRRLKCETPLRWSLDLLSSVFDCREARELAAGCQFSGQAVRSFGLLGRQTVLRPQTVSARLRRSWARRRLKSAA